MINIKEIKKLLIIQTAFLGDVILTLPLAQVIKKHSPEVQISFLCIPSTAEILANNPYVDEVIIYDKRNKNKGLRKFFTLLKKLKEKKYDIIISPHRSIRSSLISYFSKVALTISYNKSSLPMLYKKVVNYIESKHEIQRNLSLLKPLDIYEDEIVKPELFVSESDVNIVTEMLREFKITDKFITIAPGSVWFTKTYPEEKFIRLLEILKDLNIKIVLVGGKDDYGLCAKLIFSSKNFNVFNAAGRLSPLQSAELIKRSSMLLTNDSAPMHLANAVGTKVIAIFGATVPEFGFYPYGIKDVIYQINGLKCRPCSIHGGDKCPIKTFICMHNINEINLCEEIVRSI